MITMKQTVVVFITVLLAAGAVSGNILKEDWLVRQVKEPVGIEKSLDGREIVLSNSLISRTF